MHCWNNCVAPDAGRINEFGTKVFLSAKHGTKGRWFGWLQNVATMGRSWGDSNAKKRAKPTSVNSPIAKQYHVGVLPRVFADTSAMSCRNAGKIRKRSLR
jgi:hypothetical protein